MTFAVIDKLSLPVLFRKTFAGSCAKSMPLAERNIVAHHSPPAPDLMVSEPKGAAIKNKLDNHEEVDEEMALFLTPVRGDRKNTTVALELGLTTMCGTSLLVSKRVVGLSELAPHEKVVRVHACVTAESNKDVYPGPLFHITIVIFGKSDVHLSKHEKIGKVASTPGEIVRIKDECFS